MRNVTGSFKSLSLANEKSFSIDAVYASEFIVAKPRAVAQRSSKKAQADMDIVTCDLCDGIEDSIEQSQRSYCLV